MDAGGSARGGDSGASDASDDRDDARDRANLSDAEGGGGGTADRQNESVFMVGTEHAMLAIHGARRTTPRISNAMRR